MEKFISFWENINTLQRLFTVLAPLTVFWLLEYMIPKIQFSRKYHKLRHSAINLSFLGTTFIVNLILGIATLAVARWVQQKDFGLLNWVQFPIWASILFTLFIMDLFAQYIPHYLMHKVKPLWRFHVVHHSDTHVDVSTGTRHHPGEWIIRETFTILGIVLMGIPAWLYFMHRSFQAFFTYFNHANIRLPKWLDKAIGWVFVSPDMHKFHHHSKRPWTDMNFANSFSIWDRLFGTLVYDDIAKIEYGIDTLDGSKDEDLAFQFKLPFDHSIAVTLPENETVKVM
jgi:sterol desaturase/sphingolipid hydroxylase (fatty acid hydroxylase superfamily)